MAEASLVLAPSMSFDVGIATLGLADISLRVRDGEADLVRTSRVYSRVTSAVPPKPSRIRFWIVRRSNLGL